MKILLFFLALVLIALSVYAAVDYPVLFRDAKYILFVLTLVVVIMAGGKNERTA